MLSIGLAVASLIRGGRSFVRITFAAGMLALAAEQIISVLSIQGYIPAYFDHWESWKLVAAGFSLYVWLLFSAGFAREDYADSIKRWKWGSLAVLLLPLVLLVVLKDSLFTPIGGSDGPHGWALNFGWPVYIIQIVFLLACVLILANLERTLRASTGAKRWRIKFIVLGLGCLFAVRIYTISQTLLYSSIDYRLNLINSAVLIAADLMIILALIRADFGSVSVHVSTEVLSSSFSVIVVGAYLIVVGVLAKVVTYFGVAEPLLRNAFFVFLGLLGLTVIFLSNQIRQESRRFISRHFQIPRYNYRKVWTDFTQHTSLFNDTKFLCTAIARFAAETFGVSSVSIWLVENDSPTTTLCGSTSISQNNHRQLKTAQREIEVLLLSLRDRHGPVDLDRGDKVSWPMSDANPKDAIRYCAPLMSGMEFLGLITLNNRVTGEAFSLEDFDLLQTLSDQAATVLYNRRLFEELGKAKEIEAFQTISAFFVHDLKNVASTLSLTLQNLPVHYDNPEFREDTLKAISQSMHKIDNLCSRLSSMNEQIQLDKTKTHLNQLVMDTSSSVKNSLGAGVKQQLQNLPPLSLDGEQIQKVLLNLLLNANDAVANGASGGEILIETNVQDRFAVLSVSDNGCGMTRNFLEHSLFRPFKTTKKKGLGIGLYQCKMIVEAHKGKIEVESEEGKGSKFRILLPLD